MLWAQLNIHTEYSVVDGIVRLKPLFQQAQRLGYKALAITDKNNIYAHVKFYKMARQFGIKPILGADVTVSSPIEDGLCADLTLLCMNETGRLNLMHLISRAYQERADGGQVVVDAAWLSPERVNGLVAISGGMCGELGQHLCNTPAQVPSYVAWAQQTFGAFFAIGVARLGRVGESCYIQAAYDCAVAYGIPLVATGDVQFLGAKDQDAHKARVCIERGMVLEAIGDHYTYTAAQYLQAPDVMTTRFQDLPEAIENANRIATLCNVDLVLDQVFLPNYEVDHGETIESHIYKLATHNLARKFSEDVPESYSTRLSIELEVINSMGFAGYFMIVADFINWAKQNGVPVGPGRGSGAGSLVAYVLGITDVDPLPYGLLFERFLNPERVSMPDFDIDFCMLGRDTVIRYVTEKYGRMNVSQIITYGTMAAKAVVRDVGRVLGYPYGFVDSIAKLIPFDLGMTLAKALEDEPKLEQLYQTDEQVTELLNLAMKLEGITRNVGKHAGGVVIAPKPLENYTALYLESAGEGIVSQFDKDDIEAVGLVKFDFLGLRTLTIIDWAIQNIHQCSVGKEVVDIDTIPLDDSKTFDLLQSCATTGVFQLESRGMKDLIKRLVPDCFEDIVALVALFRPGPLQSGMVDNFIDCKHGRAEMVFPHEMIADILRPTYGVILYQEQVMQIAQVLANYSLGGADLLRRAMGKKKPEEMAKQRDVFVAGAKENAVDAQKASDIFDLIEKFSGYGFNKSHSVAYALISYRTAYLKAHYPAEFMAAVLSSDMDNTDKLCGFLEATKSAGITILPPDIQYSHYHFLVEAPMTIRYGFGAIKGLGEGVARAITAERDAQGTYKDLLDLCVRVGLAKMNKRSLEALAKSGAFDGWGLNRAYILASLEKATAQTERIVHDKAVGQQDLFSIGPANDHSKDQFSYVQNVPIMPSSMRFQYEREALGHYFSGHPFNRYAKELANLGIVPIDQAHAHFNKVITVAGYVSAMRVLMTKKKKKFAFVTLDNGVETLDVGVFPDIYPDVEEVLQKDAVLVVRGLLEKDDYSGRKLVSEYVETIAQVRRKHKPYLALTVHDNRTFVQTLMQAIERCERGAHRIKLCYSNSQGDKAVLDFSENYCIDLDDAILDMLEQAPGLTSYEIVY